jgi:signal transduction histidine kinase
LALALTAGVTVSATVGAIATWMGHQVTASGMWTIWHTWWLGDMSGGLLVAPLLLVWGQRLTPGTGPTLSRSVVGQAAGVLALVIALSIVAFSMSYPLPYIVFPALIVAATYFGLRGATLALACALAVAIGMTALRTVPFAQQSITSEVLSTQLYIFTATLTMLSIGAAVSARKRAAVELAQTQQRAAERAEQERQRIARDLHDSVSQTLFSLGLHAGIAKHEAGRAELSAGSALPEAIAEMAALAQAALLEMRASIFDLRGGAIAEQGLVTALAAHGAALTVRHDVRVTVSGPDDRLPLLPRTEELLYRIGQEAITNAVKHSGSEAVIAQVSADGGMITLIVCDQGGGFDPDSSYAGHLGLGLMRSRAAETGGIVEVTSAPGSGTTVRVTVPADPMPANRSGRAARPSRTASSAAWVRDVRPSLRRMLLTCVRAVRSLIVSRRAISLFALPSAISLRISVSRGDRPANGSLSGPAGADSETIRRRATAASRCTSPRCAARIATASSSGAASLMRYPEAPAWSADSTRDWSMSEVIATTSMLGRSARSCRVAVTPSTGSIARSISTTSGASPAAAIARSMASACLPLAASPTTVMSGKMDRYDRMPRRTTPWSSTTKTLIGASGSAP